MYLISPKSFDFVCVFFSDFLFFHCMFIVSSKAIIFISKLRFLSPNSMNTSSFSCFISKNFDFCLYPSWCGFDVLRFPSPSSSTFSFFYLYLYLYAFFFLVFCFFIACSLFLLKLSFLSQKVSIFISKLYQHRFVFLLSLSKVKYFCVPEPSLTLLSLHFHAFWVQICSIEYLCDRQQ